ncbi:hypothetical protein D3C75_584580 [compost metagenome]
MVITGIITIEIPNILTEYKIISVEYFVVSVRSLKKYVLITTIARPINAKTLPPNLSNNLPVIGDITPIINAPGNIRSPESRGEMPLIFCR